jgi:transcriptional regulator with XRE-family HTH domain
MEGKELRRLRKQLGWTQRRLAEAVGVAENTVARWERDELGMRKSADLLLRRIVAEHKPTKPTKRRT